MDEADWRCYNAVIRLTHGARFSDAQCGFKAALHGGAASSSRHDARRCVRSARG